MCHLVDAPTKRLFWAGHWTIRSFLCPNVDAIYIDIGTSTYTSNWVNISQASGLVPKWHAAQARDMHLSLERVDSFEQVNYIYIYDICIYIYVYIRTVNCKTIDQHSSTVLKLPNMIHDDKYTLRFQRPLFLVFSRKDHCFTKDSQLTNPGDSYFNSLGLLGYMILILYKNILIHKELHTWTGVNLVHSIANANSAT